MNDLKDLKECCGIYQIVQKARIGIENLLGRTNGVWDGSKTILNSTIESEKLCTMYMKIVVENNEVYNQFLRHINGLGVILSAKLLGLGLDIDRELSDWLAYFGLVPKYFKAECKKGHKRLYARDVIKCEERVQKRSGEVVLCGKPIVQKEMVTGRAPRLESGYKSFWSKKALALYHQIGLSFELKGKFYKEMFYRYYDREIAKGYNKDRARKRARRSVVKLFLAHFYQAWREIEGKGYRMPYQFEYLQHDLGDFVDWKSVVSYETGEEVELPGVANEY